MENINARVSVIEEKVSVANRRISDLEQSTNDLPRLEVMMGMVIETNKEQTQTLKGINENLTKLNQGYDNLDIRMGALEDNQKEIKSNSSIDLNKLKKDILTKVIPSLISGVVLAWLLITFGLK